MAFLDMETTAKEFGMTTHTLRGAAKAGKIPGARKIGGRWYVHRATLENYFAAAVPAEAAFGRVTPA